MRPIASLLLACTILLLSWCYVGLQGMQDRGNGCRRGSVDFLRIPRAYHTAKIWDPSQYLAYGTQFCNLARATNIFLMLSK